MKTIIRKIAGRGKTLASLFGGALVIVASASITARGDGLAITPATVPNAMQQVYFEQSFTASGGSGSYDWDAWQVMPWTCTEEASAYAVGENETPLWDGAQSFTN